MIKIRMPAIREIRGDSEMPAMIEVDNGIAIGPSLRGGWLSVSHNRSASRKQGRDIGDREKPGLTTAATSDVELLCSSQTLPPKFTSSTFCSSRLTHPFGVLVQFPINVCLAGKIIFSVLCRQDLRPERWNGHRFFGQRSEVELVFLDLLC